MHFQEAPNQDTGQVNVSLDYSESKNMSALLECVIIQLFVLCIKFFLLSFCELYFHYFWELLEYWVAV